MKITSGFFAFFFLFLGKDRSTFDMPANRSSKKDDFKKKKKTTKKNGMTSGSSRGGRHRAVEFVEFDESARREHLTGFRKRNLERKKAAQARHLQRLKDEKKEFRKSKVMSGDCGGGGGGNMMYIDKVILCI